MPEQPAHDDASARSTAPAPAAFGVGAGIRTAIGGLLMGIANLIPGVSGGTMILAIGLYEEFIDAVADITALRFSVRRILFLGILAGFAGCAILGLSKVILYLLLWHTVIMFALFIGLTLGGAPLLLKMIGKPSPGCITAIVAGLAVMAAVAGARQLGDMRMPRNTAMDVAAGVIGATTMVLPGISGSYMLLILDQYDRVIGSIADLKDGSWAALKIIIPVGIGAVIGVVGLSNLLKWLLHHHEKATLGFLLGMLLGSVIGLWPFSQPPTEKILERSTDDQLHSYIAREGIPPADGLSGAALAEHIQEHWRERTVDPYSARHITEAVISLIAGLVLAMLIGMMGRKVEPAHT